MASMTVSKMRVAALVAVLALCCTGCEWMTWATPSVTGGALDASAGTRALSPDGRYLIFGSKATNATPGTNTFGKENLYRRDLQTGTTARITFTTTGGDPNEGSTFSSMTADGRYVSFSTGATNMDASHMGGAFVRDMDTQSVTRPDPNASSASYSSDGHYLAVSDSSGTNYRMDTATHATVVIAKPAGVTLLGGKLNADGSRMLSSGYFTSSGVSGWWIHDFTTGTTTQVSGLPTGIIQFSTDFTKVLYQSGTTIPGLEYYVRDLTTGTDTRVTQTVDGGPLAYRDDTDLPINLGASMSGDGTHVAFWSAALNLAVGQTPQTGPDQLQVFVRDLTTGITTEVDKAWDDQPVPPYLELSENPGLETALDENGAYVAFDGLTSQYDPSVSSNQLNVFVRAVAAPQPTSMTPSTLSRGTSTAVTVTGTGFAANAQVFLITSANNATGVTISSVHVVSSTTLTATVTLAPGAPPGATAIGVLNPPPGPGIVPDSAGVGAGATISP